MISIDDKSGIIIFEEYKCFDENISGDKEEAIDELKVWKQNMLIYYEAELIDYEPFNNIEVNGENRKENPETWYEHWGENPSINSATLKQSACVYLKFYMKKKNQDIKNDL